MLPKLPPPAIRPLNVVLPAAADKVRTEGAPESRIVPVLPGPASESEATVCCVKPPKSSVPPLARDRAVLTGKMLLPALAGEPMPNHL